MGRIERNQDIVMEAESLRRLHVIVPSGFAIRPFQSRDVEIWTAIQAAADQYNVITDDLFHANFGSDPSMHHDRILMACDSHGTPVGTASAWIGEGPRRGVGRLHWVAVLPKHQGRGLGRALVQQVLNRLTELGHSAAYLTTGAARLAAIHVYDECGFHARIATESDREAWQAISGVLARMGRPLVHGVI